MGRQASQSTRIDLLTAVLICLLFEHDGTDFGYYKSTHTLPKVNKLGSKSALVVLSASPLGARAVAVIVVAPSLAAMILAHYGLRLSRSLAKPAPRKRGRASHETKKRRRRPAKVSRPGRGNPARAPPGPGGTGNALPGRATRQAAVAVRVRVKALPGNRIR
jgi:hypothetical protein